MWASDFAKIGTYLADKAETIFWLAVDFWYVALFLLVLGVSTLNDKRKARR